MQGPTKIGISGGTFDPIHHGHLIVAEEIRVRFALDRIIFVPTGKPPHKKYMEVAPAEHRFNMAALATASNPYFDVSNIETCRTGFTYTIDTVERLKAACSEGTKLYFITGADVIPQIITWKNPTKLLKMCEFIAAPRPGTDINDFKRDVGQLEKDYSAVVHIVDIPLIEISSTDIRSRVSKGESIKYLVPEAVEEYIYKYKLYE